MFICEIFYQSEKKMDVKRREKIGWKASLLNSFVEQKKNIQYFFSGNRKASTIKLRHSTFKVATV